MLCLSVSDLSLSFGTVPVLENVSFSLEENDRLGIIGVNGCGKSTLFRLICGELEPTSGAVYLSKGKTVGILRQDDAFDASDSRGTVLERMVHAFPDLLAAEARMAELEADALKRGDEAAVREYTDLHDRYVRDGGLEFRARCTSILSRLGFDEAQSARRNAQRRTANQTRAGGSALARTGYSAAGRTDQPPRYCNADMA